MKRHVFLVGMPASGKSSVGRALSGLLGMPFIDLDEEVERRAELSVAEIFRRHGELRFRRLERDALSAACRAESSVVACGGGVVLLEENRRLMRSTGTVVYLDVGRDVVAERMRAEPRPLIKDPVDVDELFRQRRDIYREVAHHRLETEGDPSDVARKIEGILG